jgi:hypothetical protein
MALVLSSNFLAVDSSGPVVFDGEIVANLSLNGQRAYVELPLLPGNHTVNGQTLSFFDFVCSYEGLLECNVTANSDIVLPFQLSCGNHPTGVAELKKGQTITIGAGGECETASVHIGNYSETRSFTRVFTNYILLESEKEVEVFRDGELLIKKYGRDYLGFPELLPGTYDVRAEGLEGKLIIEPVGTSVYGWALSAFAVLVAATLLWKGLHEGTGN